MKDMSDVPDYTLPTPKREKSAPPFGGLGEVADC